MRRTFRPSNKVDAEGKRGRPAWKEGFPGRRGGAGRSRRPCAASSSIVGDALVPCILFLAADASFVTGTLLFVDGGLTAM